MTATSRLGSTVAGVQISHPDRLIYPDLGISKIELARYFERIGDWILPHVAGRPLTLVHCPDGLAAPCLFLKHAKAWGPNALRRVSIQEKTKVGEYLVADSIEAVVSLAQMGIVEIHTWNSTAEDIERPNRLVWDLDPGPEVTWQQVVAAAQLVREVLTTLGLRSWVKTTGGRGVHVVVPLRPRLTVAACLQFSHAVAEVIERTNPRAYTTRFAKAGRERQILIDYLRNNRTNTSVCAFSPRARPGATVSMPLDWSELAEAPSRWTLATVPQRLARQTQDPWHLYWTTAETISEASFAAVTQMINGTSSEQEEDSMAKKKTARRAAAKRERIDTGTDTRFTRRSASGRFKESDDAGRSLTSDRRTRAVREVESGQGDRGDQRRRTSGARGRKSSGAARKSSGAARKAAKKR